MNSILKIFMAVSGIGFLLSLIVHVYSIFGFQIPYGEYAWNLHIGIFIVWIPTILVSQKMTKNVPQKDFWRAALKGCPQWLRRLNYVFGGYAVINFLLFIISKKSGVEKIGGTNFNEMRGFSGHWMIFYLVGYSVLYSAINSGYEDKEMKCDNGHVVPRYANYCEECGAQIRESNKTR